MPREMKDSGIEWIGEIPSHWKLKRLKALFEERKEKNDPIQTDFILSLGAAYGVVPYAEKEGGGNKAKEDLSDYRLAYPNDIVMNSMNIISGSVGISKYYGCVSPVYYMLYPRYYEEADPNYYCYMFQTKAFQRSLLGLGNGILIKESANGNFNTVRMRIPMEKLGVQLLPAPPLAEQKAIAVFLDKQCAEIDSVIEQTKATIEEYKKLKQSVITDAVTKGIRGDRPMKDSGIEWIGEIPSEWDTSKLKFESTFKQNKYSVDDGSLNYIGLENIVAWNGQYIDSDSQYDREQSLVCDKDDILFGKLRPYLAKVFICPFKQCCSGEFCVITVHKQSNRFIWYQLISHGFIFMVDRSTYGTKMPRANADYIKNMQIAIPSIDEQEEIVLYLDQKCAEIDTLIEKKTSLLEEMETYKKSLIFDYVTGKKEVTSATEEAITIVYPYFPSAIATNRPRFAQAVLMSKILDSNVSYMGRVKLEKMLFTIEHSLGFNFDTEYSREAAGPLDSSIYECEKVVSRANKWFYVNASDYGVSYKPQKDMSKYKKYYEQYFSDYNNEIERIIAIFRKYSLDQAEIVATLYGAWNDFVIEKRDYTDEDIVNHVLNNWNDSKKRFSKDVWLRAIENMRKNNLVPKGYGKHTVINPNC